MAMTELFKCNVNLPLGIAVLNQLEIRFIQN